MKLVFPASTAAALIAVAPAIAQTSQPAPAKDHRAHAQRVETRADLQARTATHFAKLDANRDGFVTQTEAESAMAERDKKRADRMEKRAEKRAERRDPSKMFDRLDANKDGQVTKAEAEAAHNARVASKGGKPAKAHAVAMGGLFEHADSNKDGAISKAEFAAAPRPERRGKGARMQRAGMRHGFAGAMFASADVNKDGKVSLAEAQQMALTHFDRADANRDGTLTPDERRASRQQMRAQRPKG